MSCRLLYKCFTILSSKIF